MKTILVFLLMLFMVISSMFIIGCNTIKTNKGYTKQQLIKKNKIDSLARMQFNNTATLSF